MATIDERLKGIPVEQLFGYYDPDLIRLNLDEIIESITPEHKCYSYILNMFEAELNRRNNKEAELKQ